MQLCARDMKVLQLKISIHNIFSVYIDPEEMGYYVLRPKENTTVSVVLFNSGNTANFSLSIQQSASGSGDTMAIQASSDNELISVEGNSLARFSVSLVASGDAADGQTSTFMVVARSLRDDSNNFFTFEATITTQPQPQYTENVRGLYK